MTVVRFESPWNQTVSLKRLVCLEMSETFFPLLVVWIPNKAALIKAVATFI